MHKLYHKKVHVLPGEDDPIHSTPQDHTHSPTHKPGPERGSSKKKQEASEEDIHPNLSPLLAALEGRHAYYLLHPYLRFTLFDVVMHSPAMLEDSVAKPLFVLFQLLNLLNHCHGNGVTVGDLGLKNVFMDARLWVQVRLPSDLLKDPLGAGAGAQGATTQKAKGSERGGQGSASQQSEVQGCVDDRVTPPPTPLDSQQPSHAGSTNTLTGGAEDHPPPLLNQSEWSQPLHLCEAVQKWRVGELSNFDYLMLLNQHAGRVVGDPNNHPLFPWVMEFTHKDGGWRDLSKSKYRLNKGDKQLNFTFMSAQEELRRGGDQEALVPHHIGDISSDVTYYVYMARKTPKEVLCSRVRPQWVPKEYPSSMEKMYIWTPDECIPEFFADTSIFKSIHPDLPDLGIPDWASSPDDLVSIHRAVLEGDVVSANLHHWIDLMFGYKLTGHDAIRSMNVYVSMVDKHKDPKNCGIVQLFRSSHPKRIQGSCAPLTILSWNTYLSMTSMMNATSFSITQPGSREAHSRAAPRKGTAPR